MSEVHSALLVRHVHPLIKAAREFRLALVGLKDDDGTDHIGDLLEALVPPYSELRVALLGIEDHRGMLPGGDYRIEYGLGSNAKLESIKADRYLLQVDDLGRLACELGNRWQWGGVVRHDGGVDTNRLLGRIDQLPRPAVEQADLDRLDGILNVIAFEGIDLHDPTREWVSATPPPVRRGPDSWKISGTTPFMPGETPSTPGKRDLVKEIYESEWHDISNWIARPLDRPYVLDSDGHQLHLIRVEEDSALRIDRNHLELRFLLRSIDGAYFMLGSSSHEWYRDRLATDDGHFILANDPVRGFFHGEISLVTPANRGLYGITKEAALAILIASGYEEDEDLKELLAPSANRKPRGCDNDERNAWLYEMYQDHSLSLGLILEKLLNRTATDKPGWNALSRPNAIVMAIQRHAKRHNLPVPRRNASD